jgi:hypothetical protein
LKQLVTNPAFGALPRPLLRPSPLTASATIREQKALDRLAKAAQPDLAAIGSVRLAGFVAALVVVMAGIAFGAGIRRGAATRS